MGIPAAAGKLLSSVCSTSYSCSFTCLLVLLWINFCFNHAQSCYRTYSGSPLSLPWCQVFSGCFSRFQPCDLHNQPTPLHYNSLIGRSLMRGQSPLHPCHAPSFLPAFVPAVLSAIHGLRPRATASSGKLSQISLVHTDLFLSQNCCSPCY